MFLSLIIILVIFLYLANLLKYEWYLRQFEGPFPIPFIGNALHFTSTKKTFECLTRYKKKYNKNFRFYLLHLPMLVITEPSAIEEILSTKHMDKQVKSKQYQLLKKWLKGGLVISDGNYWKKHRKIITPAFHFSILHQYVKAFDKISNTFVEKINVVSKGDVIDLFPLCKLIALDMISGAAMNNSTEALKNSDSKYVKSIESMGKIVIERTFNAIQAIPIFYSFTSNFRKENDCLKIIHNHSRNIITKRKNEISHKFKANEKIWENKLPFLDLLIAREANGDIQEDDVWAEVDTFLFAGHDTTASALSFILYALSRNKRVQRKLYDELEVIFGAKTDDEITINDLQNMKYLDLVIKEGLRLYPPISMIGRELTESITIENKLYPKGVTILIFFFALHRDPEYFDDPEEFLPERFLNEKTGGSFAYLPFSVGPRNCIGQKFAILELKMILSKIVKRFEFLPCDDHKLEVVNEITLTPLNGLPVRVVKRI